MSMSILCLLPATAAASGVTNPAGRVLSSCAVATALLASAMPTAAQLVIQPPRYWWELGAVGLDNASFHTAAPTTGSLTAPAAPLSYDDGRRAAFSSISFDGTEFRADAGFSTIGYGMSPAGGRSEWLYASGSAIANLALDPNGPGSARVKLVTSGLSTVSPAITPGWQFLDIGANVRLTGGFSSPVESVLFSRSTQLGTQAGQGPVDLWVQTYEFTMLKNAFYRLELSSNIWSIQSSLQATGGSAFVSARLVVEPPVVLPPIPSIPEPSTWLQIGLGLLALGVQQLRAVARRASRV